MTPNNNPLISVIIPVYNVEEYLDECILSVLNQTYKNLEIILVDDGSTDRSPLICDDYKNKDSRIKVIHKPNGGISDARNVGLDNATGDYICFVDSDDYIAPNMYEELTLLIQSTDTVIAACPFIIFDGVENCVCTYQNAYSTLHSIKISNVFQLHIECKIDVMLWNKLFKKELFTRKFKVGRTNEDFLFFYYLCKDLKDSSLEMAFCKKPYYYYRKRPNSLCSKKSLINSVLCDSIANYHEILNDVDSFLDDHILKIINNRYKEFLYGIYSVILLNQEVTEEKSKEYNMIKSYVKSLEFSEIRGHRVGFFIQKYFPKLWPFYFKMRKIKYSI